jgi:prepilin-type N-terminal cleavage/methylation domain-containing protein
MSRREAGFSLLECLVGLALTGVVTLVGAQLVGRVTRVFSLRLSQLEQRAVATKAALIFTGLVATAERSHICYFRLLSNTATWRQTPIGRALWNRPASSGIGHRERYRG